MIISPQNSSQNENCVRQKLQRKQKHAFYVQYFFSPENRAVYEMFKHMVEPDRPQIIYVSHTLHAG